jgi:hypothetical protein
MRSLASLHENRAYGSENFKGPVLNDFCNKICQQADKGGLRLRLRNRVDREFDMVNLAVKVLDRY